MRNQDFQPTILNIAKLRQKYWKKRIRHLCKKKKVKLIIYDRVDPMAGGMFYQCQFLLSQANQASTVEIDHVKIETMSRCKSWISPLISSYMLYKHMDDELDDQLKCKVIEYAFDAIIQSINAAIPPDKRPRELKHD